MQCKKSANVCILMKIVHTAGYNSRHVCESKTVFMNVIIYGSYFAVFIFRCYQLTGNHAFIDHR